MSAPRFSFVPALGHELHVTEWGDPTKKPLVMWHGLARTGRDFDELANALSTDFFVLCPDTIGRGLSSWAKDPETEYSVEFYSQLAAAMLDHYGIESTGWLGTSMGGLIGMRMASGALSQRIDWLIINDIGPEIPQDAIDRILQYAGTPPQFLNMSVAETWFRTIYEPFGPASDSFWRRMARTSVRRTCGGAHTVHYDPRIIVQFTASRDELTSWDRFELISQPTHVVWGVSSDILPSEVVERMHASGPRPQVTAFDDCGHAPTLSRPSDHARIRAVIRALEQAC